MKKLLFFFTLLFVTARLMADAPHTADAPYAAWWQKAGTFYQHQQYDSAAYYYEKVAALLPQDAVVYYNLGNAYYRLNRIGPAVLNYEKALHLKPGYREAEDNLMLTQNRIGNRIQGAKDIFFVRWWKSWTGSNTANTWAAVSLLLFLCWIGLLIAKRLGKLSGVSPRVNIALASVWLLTMIFSYASAMHRHDSGQAVVMQQDAALMATPNSSKYQSLIPEGTTVSLENTNGNWVEIQLPDGRTGWLQKDQLTKI